MITGLASKATENLIIEAASDLINVVIQAIAAEPLDPDHNAAWAERYPYIEDLNILTATKSGATDADHLERTQEYPDRYPYLAFFLDDMKPNPQSMEEHFIGSLGAHVEVKGTTFAICQREMHEIQNSIRSILVLDKSFGQLTHRGGVIDLIKFSHWTEPEFLKDAQQDHIIVLNYFYEVWYKEPIYR